MSGQGSHVFRVADARGCLRQVDVFASAGDTGLEGLTRTLWAEKRETGIAQGGGGC